MKRLLCITLLLVCIPLATAADRGTVLEIDVRGMVCAFCAEGLRRKLGELPGVASVEISLKHGRARIEVEPEHELDAGVIRQAIIDAGYTPGDVRNTT